MGMTEPRLHPLLVRHLTAAGIDPIRRPETLSQDDLIRLASVLAPTPTPNA